MKDENGLHFLGRMILSNVADSDIVALGAAVIALAYALLGIWQVWSNRP